MERKVQGRKYGIGRWKERRRVGSMGLGDGKREI